MNSQRMLLEKSTNFFKKIVGILCLTILLFFVSSDWVNAQNKDKDKAAKEKKAKKTKNSDRKENKGSKKPFNHKNGDPTLKQNMDKDKAGIKKKKKKKRSKRADKFSSKKKRGKNDKKPSTNSDEFSAKSKNRTRKPNTESDEFSAKSKNRTKKTRVVPDETGMVKTKREKDYKQPIDLNKKTVKVPVINHKRHDMKRYRNSDKLKIAPVPPRKNKPAMDDTYMIKKKRTHGNNGLPDKNPVEWKVDRSKYKSHKNPRPDMAKKNPVEWKVDRSKYKAYKNPRPDMAKRNPVEWKVDKAKMMGKKNPRPEIAKWKGNYKKPTPLYQKFLDWKKAKKIQDPFGKLYTVKVTTGRKNYRKNGRAIAMWTGDLKVRRMPKHAHPSLRWQYVKHRPSSAEIGRNRKVKKPKYDPNERKIWEPKEEYSTY